jgi:hypothetical protein
LAHRVDILSHGEGLFDVAEGRQLRYEFSSLHRLRGVLILQLRHQQLKESLLAGERVGAIRAVRG